MVSSKKLPVLDPAELYRRLSEKPGTRAPLVVWMVENYVELDRIISVARVNWQAVTEYLTDLGIRNARGTPLQKDNVRACWVRTQKIMAGQNRRPATRTQILPAQESQPPAEPRFKPVRAHDEHLWNHQPIDLPQPGASAPVKKTHPVNPAYAGLTHEQIADKILGRKPKGQ